MIQVSQHGPITAIRMARSLLGRPLYWTAAYWVDGLLIDSGPPCAASELSRVLSQVSVEQVIITHRHEDHIGGLPAIHRQFPNAKIYANHATLSVIEQPSKLAMQPYRRALWGTPKPFYKTRPIPDEIHTPHYTFRAVETPGHSPDCLTFYEPTHRWAFCGDAFIGGHEKAGNPDLNLFGVVSSLRTLEYLRPLKLFPGSGHMRHEPLNEIRGKIRYYLALCAQVRKLEAQGLAIDQIADRLLGGKSPITFWTGGHFSATRLIEACRNYNAIVSAVWQPESAEINLESSNSDWPEGDRHSDISADLGDLNDLFL